MSSGNKHSLFIALCVDAGSQMLSFQCEHCRLCISCNQITQKCDKSMQEHMYNLWGLQWISCYVRRLCVHMCSEWLLSSTQRHIQRVVIEAEGDSERQRIADCLFSTTGTEWHGVIIIKGHMCCVAPS